MGLVLATLKVRVLLPGELSGTLSKNIRKFCPVPTYFYNILGYDLPLVATLCLCKQVSEQLPLFK